MYSEIYFELKAKQMKREEARQVRGGFLVFLEGRGGSLYYIVRDTPAPLVPSVKINRASKINPAPSISGSWN